MHHLLSGHVKNLSIMTDDYELGIGANLVLIVLTSIYIFICVFH